MARPLGANLRSSFPTPTPGFYQQTQIEEEITKTLPVPKIVFKDGQILAVHTVTGKWENEIDLQRRVNQFDERRRVLVSRRKALPSQLMIDLIDGQKILDRM